MIREYESVLQLPPQMLAAVQDNMFFSDEYGASISAEGRKMILLASDEYIVPFALTQKLVFRYGAFLYQPVGFAENPKQSLRGFLDQAVVYLAKKKHVHFLNPTPAYTCFQDYPTKSKRIPFGNHVCDLSISEEEMFAKLHSKHRNCVRKAQKDGVTVEMGQNDRLLSDYMQMDEETWKRSNKNSSGRAFYEIKLKTLPENTMIFIAYKDDVPQAGAFIYYDRSCGYYMYGANKNAPYTGAGNLLQWEIMLWLKSHGVANYSFVGCRINEDEDSKYHNIQRFKERFGGELVRGYMFKCVCNKMMFGAFCRLATMRGASGGDAIDQEIGKWKDINQ